MDGRVSVILDLSDKPCQGIIKKKNIIFSIVYYAISLKLKFYRHKNGILAKEIKFQELKIMIFDE